MENDLELLKPFEDKHWMSQYEDSKNEYGEISKITKQHRRKVIEYSYRTYRGAIFKLYAKGFAKGISEIDLTAAYASTMPHLEDCAYGRWIKVSASEAYPNMASMPRLLDHIFGKGMRPKIFYGFYHVLMEYSGAEPYKYQHIPLDKKGSFAKITETVYPKTENLFENYLTLPEIEYLRERGFYVEILDGYEFVHDLPNEVRYPFKEYISSNIVLKNEAKKNGDALSEYIWKQLSNCLYGCSAQTVGKQAGPLFCPSYASYITALIRIKLTRLSRKYFSLVIAELTDAVIGNLKPGVTNEMIQADGFEVKTRFIDDKGYIFLKNGLVMNEDGFFIQARSLMKRTDDESIFDGDEVTIPCHFVNDKKSGWCLEVEIPKKRVTLKEGFDPEQTLKS